MKMRLEVLRKLGNLVTGRGFGPPAGSPVRGGGGSKNEGGWGGSDRGPTLT